MSGEPPTITLRDAALAYAGLGWRVLPLVPAGKVPLAALAPSGQHDATVDPAIIAGWWSACPEANVGIALEPSGLMALDVDHPEGPQAAIRKLRLAEARIGALPETLVQRSGSGNYHLLFRAPRDLVDGSPIPLRGSVEGITVRGKNYVVVAPSLHASGNRYTWENRGPIVPLSDEWFNALWKPQDDAGAVGIPDAVAEPEWLRGVPDEERVRLMCAHVARQEPERQGLDRQGLCWDICRTAARGFAVRDAGAVLEAMLEYGERCEPPYAREKVARRVQTAYGRATSPEWGGELRYQREQDARAGACDAFLAEQARKSIKAFASAAVTAAPNAAQEAANRARVGTPRDLPFASAGRVRT